MAQEILGEHGLTVPRQGRERMLALPKEELPGLPIRADIAEADLTAVTSRTRLTDDDLLDLIRM